ncbi:hypothetical protein [Fictibacillus terranigra]|uniref:Uncharacterized protein n=1 Tax=Fictibacillus terranigra TaxID=3058424 RepID=A0ABT8E4W9_9BACL|nr:hypothetical protein [Fictibacillus sp. CENA-BCM004]MDN4072931.1 hypothetical protein [Fictibacillus sp. CENA-BCM004]
MSKKWLLAVLCIGIIVIYFFVSRLSSPSSPAPPDIPAASLEEQVCQRVADQDDDCKGIRLFDADSHLVFAESSTGITPALTNNEFTEFKKFIYPMLNFQEFNEERGDRGPIIWQVKNKVQKNLSIIYGFAEDEAKTIVINSEGNVQPNRFFVRDNLWVWYTTFQKDEVKLPVKVTVYDAKGNMISRGNEEE